MPSTAIGNGRRSCWTATSPPRRPVVAAGGAARSSEGQRGRETASGPNWLKPGSYRRARITPTRNAIANDWIGASRVAAHKRSSNPSRGATSSERSWDMLRTASTAVSILCSASAVDTEGSSFVMNAGTRQHRRRSTATPQGAPAAAISVPSEGSRLIWRDGDFLGVAFED
jgi:hypothetical protein